MNKDISTKNTLTPLHFCVMAVLLFVVTSASAYDFYDSESGLYYNILSSSEKTVEVTFGGPQYEVTDSYVGDIVIPETVSYGSTLYSVVSIGNFAFNYCTGLTSIVIPDSVSEIGTWAFRNCTSLTSVDFGNGVTTIGFQAFYYCSSIITITSLNPVPPSCSSSALESVSKTKCALYIPLGTTNVYSSAKVWKEFYIIEEIDTSDVKSVITDDAEVTGYYTIDGKAVDAPQRGVNIVKYSDGMTKKVLVK